jgi:hypothetical protein
MNTDGRNKESIKKNYSQTQKGRDHLEVLDLDGRKTFR